MAGDRRPLAADRRCALSARGLRMLAKLGLRLSPRQVVDLVLRSGPAGDLFGLRRRGLSLSKVAKRRTGSCSTTSWRPVCSSARSATRRAGCA